MQVHETVARYRYYEKKNDSKHLSTQKDEKMQKKLRTLQVHQVLNSASFEIKSGSKVYY